MCMRMELALKGLHTLLSAMIFGIALLVLIICTFIFPISIMPRFDMLFIAAVLIQILLILYKYEHLPEILMIGVFHLLGTCMEIFKVAVGSWAYPIDGIFYIGNVPLFAGFMYAAVGSSIARSMRLFSVALHNAPDTRTLLCMSACIYCNFFTHHYIPDMRYFILGGIVFAFAQTRIRLKIQHETFQMHFLVIAIFIALCIWSAENIATYASVWKYPHQADAWELVHVEKITSWFLLLFISFTLVVSMTPHKKTYS